MNTEKLIEKALEMGATQAASFTIDDIVFDERTLLKCLYGCEGGLYYCPTAKDTINVNDYIQMTKKYKYGILICTDDLKHGQDITLALERDAFLAGYPFALGATECVMCPQCAFPDNEPCRNPHAKRIPLYALGIDVYSTVRNIGWELEVVQCKDDPRKNITAVFVE